MTGMHDKLAHSVRHTQTYKHACRKCRDRVTLILRLANAHKPIKCQHWGACSKKKQKKHMHKTQRTFNTPQLPAVNFLQARKRADTNIITPTHTP